MDGFETVTLAPGPLEAEFARLGMAGVSLRQRGEELLRCQVVDVPRTEERRERRGDVTTSV